MILIYRIVNVVSSFLTSLVGSSFTFLTTLLPLLPMTLSE